MVATSDCRDSPFSASWTTSTPALPHAPPDADGTLVLASPRPAGSKPGRQESSREAEGRGSAGGTSAGNRSTQDELQLPIQQEQLAQQGQQQQQDEQQQGEQQWAAVQALRGFGQGGVKQLVVAGERSMLLCLAGAMKALPGEGRAALKPCCGSRLPCPAATHDGPFNSASSHNQRGLCSASCRP